VCVQGQTRPAALFLCFLVLSPAFADVVSAIRVWLHHVIGSANPKVPAGSKSQLHAWTDATKLARRSAWKKLQLQKLFCLFFDPALREDCKPTLYFFSCVSGYTLREEQDPFSIVGTRNVKHSTVLQTRLRGYSMSPGYSPRIVFM